MVKIDEEKITNIIKKVRKKVTPPPNIEEEIKKTIKEFISSLNKLIKEKNIKATPKVVGSFVKNTWLPQNTEVDIFLAYHDKNNLIENLTKDLDVVKSIFDSWEDRHSEHPYIRGKYKNIIIDVVPSFLINNASEMVTAVDRTLLHTKYVNNKITPALSADIRVLKKFLRENGIYGAEIKINGFPGYACELLILYYKSFTKLLIESQKWEYGEVIDIEGYWSDKREIYKKFMTPLILVDPVDKNRNVTSALSYSNYLKFIKLAKVFLLDPSVEFFMEKKIKPLSTEKIKPLIRNHVFIVFNKPKLPEDILWGQIKRSLKGIINNLDKNGFYVVKYDAWADNSIVVFIFEVRSLTRSPYKIVYGPSIGGIGEKEFLEKYRNPPEGTRGPYKSKDNRWIVLKKRRVTYIKDYLKNVLENENEKIRLGKTIRGILKEKKRIFINGEILKFYSKNVAFASYLTKMLTEKI